MKLLYLTGFMGTGKTAVAQELAGQAAVTCDDLDSLITEYIGMSIPEYMQARGEQAFREAETAVLKQWIHDHTCGASHERAAEESVAVLACGGGVILSDENRRLLRESGTVVRLMASLQTIYQRVSAAPETRPMLASDSKLIDRIETLAQEREAFYREAADLAVSTEGKTAKETAQIILRKLNLT